jgi:hypothetical protein
MPYSTIIVKINNVWLYNLTALNQFKVAKGSGQFTADVVQNIICFDSAYKVGNMLFYPYIGPCIDNVTLIKFSSPLTPNSSNSSSITNDSQNSISNNSQNSSSPSN